MGQFGFAWQFLLTVAVLLIAAALGIPRLIKEVEKPIATASEHLPVDWTSDEGPDDLQPSGLGIAREANHPGTSTRQ